MLTVSREMVVFNGNTYRRAVVIRTMTIFGGKDGAVATTNDYVDFDGTRIYRVMYTSHAMAKRREAAQYACKAVKKN